MAESKLKGDRTKAAGAKRVPRAPKPRDARAESESPAPFSVVGANEEYDWSEWTFSLADAEKEHSERPGWVACWACRRHWAPHTSKHDDEEVRQLCGFDLVRAMNTLIELSHAHHLDQDREAAARSACQLLYTVRRTLGPERIAEIEYVQSIVALRRALNRFAAIGPTQAKREELLRGPSLTAQAMAAAAQFDALLSALEGKWSFSSEGRTLPGTRSEVGNRSKTLLAETERHLHQGGFNYDEIADLRLDGLPQNGGRERVRKRIAALNAAYGLE